MRHLMVTMAAITLLAAGGGAAAASTGVIASDPAARKTGACSPEVGQGYIDEGRYDRAVREFMCVIEADPTGIEGYRGRIEAELLLGRYSDAVRDYTRVTAYVIPVHPDAEALIYRSYDARLDAAPDDVPALTGDSFARWWFFDYGSAIHVLNHLLELRPADVYGNLFRGSSRLLHGATRTAGAADLEYAIALAPQSADVRYIVSDAYTYGSEPDPRRALDEASLALDWGLDTPRVHAVLAASYNAFGDLLAAAQHIERHLDLVTTDPAAGPALGAGGSLSLPVAPGRTWEIPVTAAAGETISIATSSKEFWDTILVLLGPDGSPVIGSDDANGYFAAIDWVAGQTGTYLLRTTSFEAVNTGTLVVKRD